MIIYAKAKNTIESGSAASKRGGTGGLIVNHTNITAILQIELNLLTEPKKRHKQDLGVSYLYHRCFLITVVKVSYI